MDKQTLTMGLAWYAVFVFSITCHEAAHAFVALKLGDATAYGGGQVTLDPRPHIRRSPFGMVIVPILTFLLGGWMMGWASAPYDPYWAETYPKRSGIMAAAGPAANLALVILAALGIRIGLALDIFQPGSMTFTEIVIANKSSFYALALILSITFSLNLLLMTFNLLPLPPLDGSGMLALILPPDKARRYRDFFLHPTFSMIGLLIAWRIFGPIFAPVYLAAIHLLYLGT